jgi:hypothetical protein
MEKIYNYKNNVNVNYWNTHLQKLDRKLTKKEKKLLKRVKNEHDDNKAIASIYQKALSKGMYVSDLTDLDGDCLFEAIELTGFHPDKHLLRRSIATIFFLFGDCKCVIPGFDDYTLKQIYTMYNDIEYVYCHNKKKLYKYSYMTMCSDMFTDGSWSRLVTELVLRVICNIFKVKIHIFHDNGHIQEICDDSIDVDENDDSSNIYLGLIGEHHYVPIKHKVGREDETICPQYIGQYKKFKKWACKISDRIGLYHYVNNNSEQKENITNDFIGQNQRE